MLSQMESLQDICFGTDLDERIEKLQNAFDNTPVYERLFVWEVDPKVHK